MRVIDCPCGHTFQAGDDEELVRLCLEHVRQAHPGLQRMEVATDPKDA